MAFYRRSAWTKASNAAVGLKRKQVHLTFHHPGFGNSSIKTAGWSLQRCFNQLRAWRNMHVGSGAYREVAYSLYALPTGDVAEGRGVHRQNGANGTSVSNRAGLSIQVLKGDTEPLTTKMIGAIFDAMAIAEKAHPGIVKRQYGHRHWVSTTCPGNTVQERIPFKGGGSAPAPAKQAPWESSPRVRGMSAAEVRKVQKALQDRGYDLGKWGVDGKYGEATYNAVRAAQKALGVAADGIAGPDTMNALTKASKPAAKPAAKPKAPAFPLPRKAPNDLFYYGPQSGPRTSISGQTRNTNVPHDVVKVAGRWRSKGLARAQQRLIDRGWNELKSAGGADGRFGVVTEKVIGQFQKSKGLPVDRKLGPATWRALWEEPVT